MEHCIGLPLLLLRNNWGTRERLTGAEVKVVIVSCNFYLWRVISSSSHRVLGWELHTPFKYKRIDSFTGVAYVVCFCRATFFCGSFIFISYTSNLIKSP